MSISMTYTEEQAQATGNNHIRSRSSTTENSTLRAQSSNSTTNQTGGQPLESSPLPREACGIHQTHERLLRPARDPPAEEAAPVIHRGVRNPQVILLPPIDDEEEYDSQATKQSIYLMRQSDPSFAYQKVPGKVPKKLGHAEGWGKLEMGVLFHRDRQQDNKKPPAAATAAAASAATAAPLYTFRQPTEDTVEYVAIKTLRKKVVQAYLDKGGHENPYTEILRMQQMGDNEHVLECIEALEDDNFLYIITPFCMEGSLNDNIPWAFTCQEGDSPGYPEEEARDLFQQILDILCYLEEHGICHHDISPDNFMFYKGKLLLMDFAMSMRIPRRTVVASGDDGEEQQWQRHLIKPQGRFGTFAYQAPEVFLSKGPFDGVAADLWSAAVTLYNLLTGQTLCQWPHPTCIIFRYYILAGAMSRRPVNDRTVEILRETFQNGSNDDEQHALLSRARANLGVPEDAMDLLEHMLQVDPSKRWTLGQAMESEWVLQDDSDDDEDEEDSDDDDDKEEEEEEDVDG